MKKPITKRMGLDRIDVMRGHSGLLMSHHCVKSQQDGNDNAHE